MRALEAFFLVFVLLSSVPSGCDMAMGSNSYLNASQSSGGCGYQDYRCMARQDAIDNYLDADLFERQINMESGFNPYAVSPAGAIGIAQIMPDTAAGWGVDPHDPVASLKAASSAMSRYNNQYGSYAKALAAYNCGTYCVNTAIAEYGVNWRADIPAETDRYITAIMGS